MSGQRRGTGNVVSIVLSASAGLSVVILTVSALIDAQMNPGNEMSPSYASLLTGTLGVLVGSLAGAIPRRQDDEDPTQQRAARPPSTSGPPPPTAPSTATTPPPPPPPEPIGRHRP